MAEPKKKETDKKNDEEKQQRIKDKEKEWADLLKESKETEEQKEQEKESKMEDKMERTRERPQRLSGPKSKYMLFVQIGVVILIGVVVCFFMVPRMAPSIGEYTGTIANIDNRIDGHDSAITQLSSFTIAMNSSISGLVTRTELNNYATKGDINSVSSRIGNTETALSELENNLASQLKPTVEYDLAGTFGNYTLSARTNEVGNFTARLNLVYLPAEAIGIANSTLEEALLSFNTTWLISLDKNYTPSLVYDNQWKISQVSFLTKFSLVANNLTPISITFTGLNVTPDYVFAEVFPVL